MEYVLKNRLKEFRARDGLNQTELAKLAEVSRQTISLIERGEYTPSVVIAMRIAQIFNENVENVFQLVEVAKWNKENKFQRNKDGWDIQRICWFQQFWVALSVSLEY